METPDNSLRNRISRFLTVCEDVIYSLLGILLVVVAGVVVYSAALSLIDIFRADHLAAGIVGVIDKILLGLMVAEILYTVVKSFETHSLEAEPFLIVGLIAAVRRVLLISLEAAHVSEIGHDLFIDYMIEMGVLTVLILFFGIAIFLLRKYKRAA